MTHKEFYHCIQLPEGVIAQLDHYEEQRQRELPTDIREKLFSRSQWDEGVKELQAFLGEEPYHINVLWEQINLVCTYSYPEYERRGISKQIFADTFGFLTRFLKDERDAEGKYTYHWAWWFQRQVTLQEFRIGSLEYEFVEEADGHRVVEVHIPSDADMSLQALKKSLLDFVKFEEVYQPDWLGVEVATQTWMIMPELQEFLPSQSGILGFKSLFIIDSVDYEQNWYMGWIFPGFTGENRSSQKAEGASAFRQEIRNCAGAPELGEGERYLINRTANRGGNQAGRLVG